MCFTYESKEEHYKNKEKKDMKVTARIQEILRQRDEAIRGIDLGKSFAILCSSVSSML